MRKNIERFCTVIGSNPMLAQGAGGNISWKDGDILWVKASGMWMSDAEKEDIFVPVNLRNILKEIAKFNYLVDIRALASSELRPSIETILHALMPYKVVLHIHPVEILPYLVTENYEELISSIIEDSYNSAYVNYKKPGPDLAQAVSEIFLNSPDVQILFLQNHGIVIGGADIDEIGEILDFLKSLTKNSLIREDNSTVSVDKDNIPTDYQVIPDKKINHLVRNDIYFYHTKFNWALYPDHIVFLGGSSFCYEDINEFLLSEERPGLIFIKGVGVFTREKLNLAQLAQLRCYYDVVCRLDSQHKIKTLKYSQISELLDWNLEKYRIKNAK